MKVRELMTTDVTTAELATTLEEIATIMRHEDVGAVPIMDDDELVGIVTDRDIVVRCVAEGGDPGESTAEDILTEGLVTVAPDSDVQEAEEMMSRQKVRRLPVIREGRLVGMISLGDIAVKLRQNEWHGQVSGGREVEEEKRRPRVVPIRPGERASSAPHHPKRKSG